MNTTTVTSDNWAWYESQIDSMSEVNVYGVNAFSSGGYDTALDHCQYAIFRLKSEYIYSNGSGSRFSYWLKNVVNHNNFAFAAENGSASRRISGELGSVRPRFL